MSGVFANTREVSGKSTPNKTIAAFPDVCMSPPSPPAGPVPIPYPITGISSDTQSGTGSVHIGKKEVGKKNASKYGKVNGNQPATNSFGAGVISHKITGPLKFAAYSFDVVFEKSGAERFMDMTTQNHMNNGNTSPGFSVAALQPPGQAQADDCNKMRGEVEDAREKLDKKMENRAESSQDTARRGTITSSNSSPGGPTTLTASHGIMRTALRQAGVPVAEPVALPPGSDRNTPVDSDVCGGGHQHPGSDRARHCEAQAIDLADWAPNPPASMTFAIDYPAINKRTGLADIKKKNMPCRFCKELLQTACSCDVAIYICTESGPVNYCQKLQDGEA